MSQKNVVNSKTQNSRIIVTLSTTINAKMQAYKNTNKYLKAYVHIK